MIGLPDRPYGPILVSYWALLHNLVAGARVGTRGAYLGGHEQAISRPLPHDELA